GGHARRSRCEPLPRFIGQVARRRKPVDGAGRGAGRHLTARAGFDCMRAMLVKMRRDATADEITTVERKLHDLGFKTGKLEGEEITLVGVYGDISKLPQGEIAELAGGEAARRV